MRLDAKILQQAVGCSAALAEKYAEPLAQACERYEINTPARLAAFLAQIGHESGSLRYTAEIWGPTPAQARYEGRGDLGNTVPGDGFRFRGRGFIQVTGRFNYERMSRRLGVNLIADPDWLQGPTGAALSAADFWGDMGLNALADAGDFEAITRRINGGLNGQADRLARHVRAKAALEVDQAPPAPAATPTPPAPAPAPAAPAHTESTPMFLTSALTALIGVAPALGKLFGSGSEVSERNIKAAELVVGVAKEALGAKNEQELIETVRSDPAAAQTVRTAIEANWYRLDEIGGGVQAARAFNVQQSSIDPKRNMALWVTAALLPLVYVVVATVLFKDGFSDDVRAMTVAAVISGVLGAITGYWLGTSFSSAKKDERAASTSTTP